MRGQLVLNDPSGPASRSELVSRLLSGVVAAGYVVFCLAIGSTSALVGLIPYLSLALLCTCIPRSMGQGRRSFGYLNDPVLFNRRRWRWSPPHLVMAGGWVLLLLPGAGGVLLWLMGRK